MGNVTDLYLNRLHPLVGGTITGLARSGPSESPFHEEFYGLVVTLPDGRTRTITLLSDDEGNGPGSFEISE